MVALLGAAVLTVVAAAPASAINPADEAATHAFLQAEYEHEVAVVRAEPAEAAAAKAFADQLGGECAGVLKGEPSEEGEGPVPTAQPTPRQRGEQARRGHQRSTIQEELQQAFLGALGQPDLPALRAFAAQTANLTWSDPRIAALIKAEVSSSLRTTEAPPTSVCADMRAWAASGFNALSPATRAFEASQRSRVRELETLVTLQSLLKPTEGPAELALVKRAKNYALRSGRAAIRPYEEVERLEHTLGRPENTFERREHAPVIAHGVTATGRKYTIRVNTPETDFGPTCRRAVTVELTDTTRRQGVVVSSGGTDSTLCLDKREMRGSPSAQGGCEGLTVYTAVPASVRTVELRLRDGRTITSGVVRIPRRYGGPAGVYVESVPGKNAQPVSLTELDKAGRVVAVRRFGPEYRCPRHEPEVHLPKLVTLVSGTTPSGEPFTVNGTLVHFGRHYEFSLNAFGPATGGGLVEEISGEAIESPRGSRAFKQSLTTECAPHAYAIVYGTLAPPAATVLARTPAGLVPLTVVPIAAGLHAPGPLAYGAFTEIPSELIVRRADGSTLYTESLAAKVAEEAQYCAGYAEP
jgi:hypothetical protein